MIWFQLGREYKLSVAEILAVFPYGKTVYLGKDFLILENIDKENVLSKANTLWWTIKIIEIIDSTIVDEALKSEWKFKYWISIFWEKKNLKSILIWIKKELKENNISSRFVNKDFTNLSSAQILGEHLLKSESDYSYVYIKNPSPSIALQGLPLNLREENNWKYYIWKTIWVQDIYNYSKRDYEKDRDMQTGMLPPKLCQMMINIACIQNPSPSVALQGLPLTSKEEKNKEQVIYDPFVWLWTVLIESILMWNKSIYWSDLSDIMVEKSISNINWFVKDHNLDLENNKIIKLNAKFIHESEILLNKKIDSIVTEWYLWEMMTQKNISIERINKQKESLLELYDRFFEWLKKIHYEWNIVICFPFWEMNTKYIYFTEIYDLLNKHCNIESMFSIQNEVETTKAGSLLYKRDKQLVWREIFKLSLK